MLADRAVASRSPPEATSAKVGENVLKRFRSTRRQLIATSASAYLLAGATSLGLSLTPNAALAWEPGDDWKDSQCQTIRDAGGDLLNKCQAIYDGNKVYIGMYWDDGAEVVGPCSAADPEPIEFKGMSKKDAQSWVENYCP